MCASHLGGPIYVIDADMNTVTEGGAGCVFGIDRFIDVLEFRFGTIRLHRTTSGTGTGTGPPPRP